MNLREGTRRLALLLGAVGAILGALGSYAQLQSLIHQRTAHKHFEQLANLPAVQQEREWRDPQYQYVRLPNGNWGRFRADASDAAIRGAIERDFPGTYKLPKGGSFLPAGSKPAPYSKVSPPYSDVPSDASAMKPINSLAISDRPPDTAEKPWEETAAKYRVEHADINAFGVKTVIFTKDLAIESIETTNGETLFPTPSPARWQYVVAATFTFLGFFIPWGTVRAIGWVGAGFAQSSR